MVRVVTERFETTLYSTLDGRTGSSSGVSDDKGGVTRTRAGGCVTPSVGPGLGVRDPTTVRPSTRENLCCRPSPSRCPSTRDIPTVRTLGGRGVALKELQSKEVF